jgi:hypothetical protein
MTTKKRRKNRLPPFIAVFKSIMAMPAWRAMSIGARLLNIELRGHLRNGCSNNGSVHLSCRKGAEALGVTTTSIVHWFAENEHYGFLRKTSEGFLGVDGRGIAAKYRFTDVAHGTHPPTRDFEKWDCELFAYTRRRPARKKQNPVPFGHTPRTISSHIRKGSRGASVCVTESHIEPTPECTISSHVSRRTSPQRSGRVKQGSSTARAPVQAGDAGSSPAPVTKDPSRHSHEAIMALVAGVVTEQLDARLMLILRPRLPRPQRTITRNSKE